MISLALRCICTYAPRALRGVEKKTAAILRKTALVLALAPPSRCALIVLVAMITATLATAVTGAVGGHSGARSILLIP
jgi:hypothetical protein